MIYWLKERECSIQFLNVNDFTQAIQFLDDSLFFEHHIGHKLKVSSNPRCTTQPLLKIHQSKSHEYLATSLLPWLVRQTGIAEPSFYPLKTSVSEIFNNIFDHAGHDTGCFFAQHFPNDELISLSISDFGIGIPVAVRKVIPDISDSDAILKAVEDGFTTRSRAANKGAGLDYLLRSLVMANRGHVTFYSRGAMVRFKSNGAEIQSTIFPSVGFCPGTTVDITLSTNRIEIVTEELEDLQW